MDKKSARGLYEAPEVELLTFEMENNILSNESGSGENWGTLSRRRDSEGDEFEMN